MKNKKGFTMIELLGVIVILGIILVIAVPKISETIKNYRISNFENQKELMYKAADKYIEVNRVENGIVTYKKLIDEGLLKNGIVDENGKPLIPEGTTINTKTKKITYSTDTEDKSGIILSYKANGLPLKDYKIYGNSTQETRSSKNLVRTSDKTGVANIYFGYNTVLQAGTYTLSVETTDALNNIYIYETGQGSAIFYKYNTNSITFIIDEAKSLYFKVWSRNFSSPEHLLKAQLEVGSSVTTYEPYGAMPSPEFPSEVVSLGEESNEIDVVSSGKNMFDPTFVNNILYENNINHHYSRTVKDGVECYEFKTSSSFIPILTNFKENTQYTISGMFKGSIMYSNSARFYFKYSDGTYSYFGTTSTDWGKPTTISTAGKTVVEFGAYAINGLNYPSYLYDVQLEEGATATDYEPYVAPITTTIDLTGHQPLRKIGDVADYIDYKNGKIVRNIGKKVFDGTEMITFSAERWFIEKSTIADVNKNTISASSNYFLSASKSNLNLNNYIFQNTDNNRIYMYCGGLTNLYTTSNSIQTYLAQQYANDTPVTVYYQLAEPDDTETIDLPQIPTFNGTTNISVEGASNIEGTFYN